MLLIHCPWCGERPEIEFSYGGQAHLVRPPIPAALSDEQWGAYLYLRDNDSGEFWSPSWQPTQTALDSYECRHGLSYTRIGSAYAGVHAETLYFVPLGESLEIWQVTLTNESGSDADLSLFSAIEFCLWDANDDATNFQRNYSIGQVEIVDDVIYHKTEYRERRNHYAFYHAASEISGFDTDRESFTGLYAGLDAPDAMREGRSRGSLASGWAPIASHSLRLTLAPGETRTLVFARFSAASRSATVMRVPGSRYATPFRRGISYSTPRVMMPSFMVSTAFRLAPSSLVTRSATGYPFHILPPKKRCANPSRCVVPGPWMQGYATRSVAPLWLALTISVGCASVSSQASPLIEYQRSGGITGREDRLVVLTDGTARLARGTATIEFRVSPDTLEALRSLVGAARFDELRAEYLPPRQGADLFEYVVVCQRRRVRTMDTAVPPELEPLIRLLNGLLATKTG